MLQKIKADTYAIKLRYTTMKAKIIIFCLMFFSLLFAQEQTVTSIGVKLMFYQ